jgi:hypothetical protein
MSSVQLLFFWMPISFFYETDHIVIIIRIGREGQGFYPQKAMDIFDIL